MIFIATNVAKRDRLWDEFYSKIDPKELEKMEEDGNLDYIFMGIDIAMVLKNTSEKK